MSTTNPLHQRPQPATLCVHAGTYHDERSGGVNTPIFTSTAYAFPNPANENVYPRYFNVPNQKSLAAKVAALEKAEAGLVFGSGMAAISTLLFAWLKPGDHAICQSGLYGGTHHFITHELAAFGIELSFVSNPDQLREALRPSSRVVYVESPSNPLLRCIDLVAVAALARKHGALSIIDNTFATPINQNPIDLGFDAVIHSATKYLNGQSDINAGVVVSSAAVVGNLNEYAVNHGGMLDAHACYQVERGMKTLALRIKQQNENAATLARFLETHPAVERVFYPGLVSHPDHAIAARQMRGFGGMLSFELRRPEQVDAMLSGFQLALPALSLGGVETLVCIPSRTSHRTMKPQDRKQAGISDGLVRVSVGIEDVADLKADFEEALAN